MLITYCWKLYPFYNVFVLRRVKTILFFMHCKKTLCTWHMDKFSLQRFTYKTIGYKGVPALQVSLRCANTQMLGTDTWEEMQH